MDSNEDTTDETFHPLGESWQNDLEELLEETEYDTELGFEMARDAMAVTKGELTEAEFHDRYHEDMLEEFGEDQRPIAESTADEDGGRFEKTLSQLGVDEKSRREVMKKVGAGAGFIGLGAWGTAETGPSDGGSPSAAVQHAEEDEGDDGTQWGMVLDNERCDACLACVVACAEEHNWDQGANWMYILDYEDSTPGGQNRLIRPCQHCTDAPCEKVCPTTARHTRDSDGLVLTDYDVCIGCRYCQVACPYGVNYFQWGEPDVPQEELDEDHVYDERGRPVGSRAKRGTMSKCTFCATRQDGTKGEEFVGTTACEDACPPEAIQFGDMNDPESDPQQYLDDPSLARVQAMNPDDETVQEAIDVLTGDTEPAETEDADGMTETEARALVQAEGGTVDSTYKLLEDIGTNPNIVYLGNQPGPNAHQVDGPMDYAEVGQTDDRKDVLDRRTVDIESFE
ncbi:4Fe-4S ferredoxin N-terminal domain-containing protein [Halopiger djelfimassiliensis]|uniref:4Fe-4S ferredoxin N-terminal domain-containing protein n=1 Tax=Halopiger djelfimassiliensis TaxID=1293047 RepID=UPI000678086E|nr:4Fe-4S ferredoxin N-terminal domain-containing protein [Halopiger djelfimassiliensis]